MIPHDVASLVFVTGASRGIGKEIVLQMAAKVNEKSVFFITARDADKLAETKEEVLKINPSLTVHQIAFDLAKLSDVEESAIKKKLNHILESQKFQYVYIFHNAATVGDTSKPALELSCRLSWNAYLDLNVVSMIRLNSLLLATVTQEKVPNRFVINITSLVALQGFPSLSQYSVGKSARESYFRVLASEEPSLNILNYSPGPVDTDMHTEIAQNTFDESIKAAFSDSKESTEIHRQKLTPTQTVTRLVDILEKHDTFPNATRIDYFDKDEE